GRGGKERVQPGAVEDVAVGEERVVTGRRDDDAADQEGDDGGQQWNRDAPGALAEPHLPGERDPRLVVARRRLRHEAGIPEPRRREAFLARAHAAASVLRRPPSISSPISCSLTSGVCSPTIPPSYITRMRSDSDRTSSSSSEISRIARPSSRSSTSRPCRYSIAPT